MACIHITAGTFVQRPARTARRLQTRISTVYQTVQPASEALEQRMEEPQCERESRLQTNVFQTDQQLRPRRLVEAN